MLPILVATDLSARSDIALRRAAQLARATGAPLHIIHVLDDDLPGALLTEQATAMERALAAVVASIAEVAALSPRIDVEIGHLARILPRVVEDREAALLVLGSHRGRGLADLLGAPTLSRLLAAIECPLLVAVTKPETPWTQAIVGWDFSPAAGAAADLTLSLAPAATISLVHGWNDVSYTSAYGMDAAGAAHPAAVERLSAALDAASARIGNAPGPDDIQHRALPGAAADILLREARDGAADVIAVGRHARSGLTRFLLGETAQRVALHAPCDVLIAPPE